MPIPSLRRKSSVIIRFFFFFIVALSLSPLLSAKTQSTSEIYMAGDRPYALELFGDRYNYPMHVRKGLMGPLTLENILLVNLQNLEALTVATLKDVEVLIFLKDGQILSNGYDSGSQVIWMANEKKQAIYDFVNNGGGFLALHNSHGVYPPNGLYYKVCRGNYGGHPAPEEFMIRIDAKNHAISADVEDFIAYDEQHMSKSYGQPNQLLIRNFSDANKAAPARWRRDI